jgi:hypothetical protein
MEEINMKPIYIEVEAGVRYWEDATVNGSADDNGTLTPLKRADCWCPVIRLVDGVVIDWPSGVVAEIRFKVCDAGKYWLLDENKQQIAEWAGYYVPDEFLCPGTNGYGDYIIMNIDADGRIQNWTSPVVKYVCECADKDESQSRWRKLDPKVSA